MQTRMTHFLRSFFLVAVVTLYACSSFAWFCDEGASRRSGSTFEVCGKVTADNEATARDESLKAAFHEFESLCSQSDDCRDHKTTVDPKRTECSQSSNGFTCARMLVIEILPDRKTVSFKDTKVVAIVSGDSPKIRKGSTKTEVLEAFGRPATVISVDDRFLILNYTDERFCNGRCTIGFDHDSVYKFDNFKPEFTDVLETKSFWNKLTEGF